EKATGDPDGDVYVAKINQAGDGLVWSTYLGGSDGEQNANLAINFAGDVYVTGATRSADFPLRGSPFQTANYTSDGYDGFLSIFNRTGQLVYSSYFGGIGSEYPTGIGLDVLGNIYISGFANFSGLPSINAIQPAYGGGNSDGFIVKFNPTANSLLFSTYLGGSADDLISGISVLPLGTVYVAGWTQSGDFPVRNAIQPHLAGQCVTNGCVQYHDAFVAKIADSAGGASDTNLLISLRTGHIQ